MTLTTDREEFEQWAELACELPWGFLAKRRKDSGEYADSSYEDMWQAWVAGREALANREAQPVTTESLSMEKAYQRAEREMALCSSARDIFRFSMIELLSENRLYTAPPATAVPDDWIACAERMPEHGKMVAFTSNGRVMAGNYDDGRHLKKPVGKWKWMGRKYSLPVTHWMPLPAAPEGGN